MKVCLLLPDLYYYVVFPRGQLLVMDLHPTENPGPDTEGISEDLFFFQLPYSLRYINLASTFVTRQGVCLSHVMHYL